MQKGLLGSPGIALTSLGLELNLMSALVLRFSLPRNARRSYNAGWFILDTDQNPLTGSQVSMLEEVIKV